MTSKSEIVVSVVIPAYDAAESIQTALNSVEAQTFRDYEVIVVNDGSPDTYALEAALQPYRSRIHYIHQPNRGPAAARNRAILEARGKYVAFLDSDDYWHPEHLATQVAMLRSDPTLGLVYCDSQLIKNGVRFRRTFECESQVLPVTFDALLEELCTVHTSTTVASRQDMIEAGLFDEALVRCEDFDLWLRMAFRGTRMTHHSQANVSRTVSGNSLSANGYLMRQARLAVLSKVGSSLPLSHSQRGLLAKRLRVAQAMVNLDRFKLLMNAEQFADALQAARHAVSVLPNWKLKLAVSGLRRAPYVVRACYRFHERALVARSQRRLSRYARATSA